jgi:hypothetical protein
MTFINGAGHCDFRVDQNQPQKFPYKFILQIFTLRHKMTQAKGY